MRSHGHTTAVRGHAGPPPTWATQLPAGRQRVEGLPLTAIHGLLTMADTRRTRIRADRVPAASTGDVVRPLPDATPSLVGTTSGS